ncbi:hypothetical protein, partial [Thiolapillus sp.]|uniref:hypothetical protein n=1 Tax=Thiolapillus sp. TaxID=2017437 RepID=UPI003AF6880B
MTEALPLRSVGTFIELLIGAMLSPAGFVHAQSLDKLLQAASCSLPRQLGGSNFLHLRFHRKRPRIDTCSLITTCHRLSPASPQHRRIPWHRPTPLTAPL